jgi:2-aminoethylphosphonate-pyruvate transaminase
MTSFKGPDGQEDMPYLLTPGPVTTTRAVKFALLADWGDRDMEFTSLIRANARELKKIAGCDESYECVFMQGSGSSGMEAALGTLTPSKRKKTLVLGNGPSGQYAVKIMQRMGRNHVVMEADHLQALRPQDVAKRLEEDRNITHVWAVHCETATGLINPVAEICKQVKSRGRIMMVDATATFGALPIAMHDNGIDVVLSCPELCLESVPGFSFVLARRALLETSEGESPSLAFDLHDQWRWFESTGHFRSTPPTHSLVALRQALSELDAEGGVEGRGQRYRATSHALVTRIKALGFSTLLPASDVGPIVLTICAPGDPKFNFKTFNQKLRQYGFAISADEQKGVPHFRIATIGQIDEKLMVQLIAAIETVMTDMNVRNFAPSDT